MMIVGHVPLVLPVCANAGTTQLSVACTLGSAGIWLGQLIPKFAGTFLTSTREI